MIKRLLIGKILSAILLQKMKKENWSRAIFEEAGFDVELIDLKRIISAEKRWCAAYHTSGVTDQQNTTNSDIKEEIAIVAELKFKFIRKTDQKYKLKRLVSHRRISFRLLSVFHRKSRAKTS